jgi:protoporphyrinogen oxidase
MKIGVLGAGISGLSIARMLKDQFAVEILEKNELPGGIARTKEINGIPYHLVGGHCFNSKYQEVLDFVFTQILPLNEWRKIERKSRIKFRQHEVDYPIEFAIKQIYSFDKDLAMRMTSDFLNNSDNLIYTDLEDWFIKKFGKTLAHEYFIPYNEKIWNNKLSTMSYRWVEDKLPIPDKFNFFESLIGKCRDKMPHSEFYYPKSNNQNTFIDRLAGNVKIIYNYPVNAIEFKNKHWTINNEKKYDLIISTLPLKEIPFLLMDVPEKVKEAGEKLKYNKISNILCKGVPTDKTWTYIPAENSIFHRYIHIGAYLSPVQPYSILESVGERSFDEMKRFAKKDSSIVEIVDHHISGYAYVVFDENYEKSAGLIKDYLSEKKLYTLGRFGEWQYYNMDVCIKKAIDLSKKIQLLS